MKFFSIGDGFRVQRIKDNAKRVPVTDISQGKSSFDSAMRITSLSDVLVNSRMRE